MQGTLSIPAGVYVANWNLHPWKRVSLSDVHNFVQVDKAAEYMEKAKALDDRDDTLYEVKARRSDGSVSGRGIYLREPLDAQRPVNCTIEVKPVVNEVRQSWKCHPEGSWHCRA